jgi:head-tail adaptor
MLKAGNLDRRVTLLRRVVTHDGLQRVESWEALGNPRWCSRKPLPGGERGEAEARRSFARYSLWLRRDSKTRTLTAADGVAIDGERFELLQPPLEVQRREGVELLVEGTGEAWPPPAP